MKNYPLLTVNHKKRFYNWRNNYIMPLLQQVKDLSYYSYFMETPYREIENIQNYDSQKAYNENDKVIRREPVLDEEPVIYKNQAYQCIVKKSQIGWNAEEWIALDYEEVSISQGNNFNYSNMPTHAFIQLTTESSVGAITLPSGTWVVSNARNEGTLSLINDFNNYTYMPGGYGSFYVLTDILYNESNNTYDMYFTYSRNAGEIYGYSPKSNLIFSENRFVLKPSIAPLKINEAKGKTIYSENLGTLLNNDSFTEWYTLGTPMHFFFTENIVDAENNRTNYGEEVILDETSIINLEYGNTHSYTINSKHDDVRLFYIDFI